MNRSLRSAGFQPAVSPTFSRPGVGLRERVQVAGPVGNARHVRVVRVENPRYSRLESLRYRVHGPKARPTWDWRLSMNRVGLQGSAARIQEEPRTTPTTRNEEPTERRSSETRRPIGPGHWMVNHPEQGKGLGSSRLSPISRVPWFPRLDRQGWSFKSNPPVVHGSEAYLGYDGGCPLTPPAATPAPAPTVRRGRRGFPGWSGPLSPWAGCQRRGAGCRRASTPSCR